MERTAIAAWNGKLKEGEGRLTTQSASLRDARFSFPTRFGGEPGTNPEELIAAAHASCFSMALSLMLGNNQLTPEYIRTKADVTLDKVGEGFAITSSHLTVHAKIPGADAATFTRIANEAKAGCPVSKVLNATITMDATLDA